MNSPLVTLEPASDADAEALAALRVLAMRESLERVGRFDAERARERFLSGFSARHTRHVCLDGHRVGFVVVRPHDDGLLLDHLYVTPEAQGRGIGAAVLERVFAEADARGHALRVGALKQSDSNRFYERHGFERVEVGEWDNYYVRDARRAGGARGETTMEFWFEFASTYSYPAAMRVEREVERAGVALEWRPFLLGPIFGQQGWDDSPFNIYEAKGRYMWRDLERVCEGLGIPFRKPSVFPRNGLLAARIACEFARESWIGSFVRAVYSANFAEDREIADASVLSQILSELALPAQSIVAQASSAESKARLREQTDEAQRLGIFGAPSFRVGAELFWGNDRLENALRWPRA